MKNSISILGTRGIPANHGGFETFAEYLAIYLLDNGWDVYVYCQVEGNEKISIDYWKGIKLIKVPVNINGALGTILFDLKSTIHASRTNSLILTLGYNTALFSLLYRISRNRNIINMDGIEWKREKWSVIEKTWLYLNERIACLVANHLIADHPEIKNHLSTRVSREKISIIPYGADEVVSGNMDVLTKYNLVSNEYAIVIARPEPENSILEIVTAFSKRPRGRKLVVLGKYDNSNYCKSVLEAASNEIMFPGAIYDKEIVQALRFHSALYIHGHQVGGTNPSLVEALGAGCAVLAHDNKFNRWVAGDKSSFFNTIKDCDVKLSSLFNNTKHLTDMKKSSLEVYRERFIWNNILQEYNDLLLAYR
ncbi:MAG: DUF1972 domain-containing protein [Candidatus Thiodiazotropha endolucinida]|nr:DUF1972 domain-containing protein [Candidatus Thiodiazotropha taylori]MCG8096268.1 DUF1972 domain-containing protein [Candidatus Thiodiazotropha endolucinida]MCW4315072.1 DUF1972 domain-containing protein [Candidatus Thiodiazotropha taylori]